MIIAVIIFVAGSSIQAGAVSTGMLFVGEFWPGTIAGYILMM
jgi:hypothetical protein